MCAQGQTRPLRERLFGALLRSLFHEGPGSTRESSPLSPAAGADFAADFLAAAPVSQVKFLVSYLASYLIRDGDCCRTLNFHNKLFHWRTLTLIFFPKMLLADVSCLFLPARSIIRIQNPS